MADPQFEQFRQIFEKLPQHIKAPQHCYSLTHDLTPDSSPVDDSCDENSEEIPPLLPQELMNKNSTDPSQLGVVNVNRFENGNLFQETNDDNVSYSIATNLEQTLVSQQPGERKRRKLPPIPTDKTVTSASVVFTTRPPSLADEICEAESHANYGSSIYSSSHQQLPIGVYLNHSPRKTPVYKLNINKNDFSQPEEDSSPEEKFPNIDFDSGNSTAHSPDGAKCFSPAINDYSPPLSPGSSSGVSSSTLELLEATHRGLHKFVPRHIDEIEIEIGDPVYIQKEADDLWCEGVNLRTGRGGAFPSAYVTDVEYTDFDPECVQVKKERYLLQFLGSLEVTQHKGNRVLCQVVRKIVRTFEPAPHPPHPCILEVSDQGLRMVDKSKPAPNHVPCHDYFFNLKNVTFCGYHPGDHRYFGFITKHPTQNRLACHIFVGEESTRCVAEAVGRAFHRFYHKFIETAYPVEDIYLE